jgi:hypothetical protein
MEIEEDFMDKGKRLGLMNSTIDEMMDEIDRLRKERVTPNVDLPPMVDGPTRKILVEVDVPENWETRLDMQWVLEREIHADRWIWKFKD